MYISMKIADFYKTILRRNFFRGQDRIFNFLFKNNALHNGQKIVSPLLGNFKICCDTNTWIGAKIYYTGDYEPELKKIFKSNINVGDTVLDIGANIGFHSMYFAELVGKNGRVIAFEPVPYNFESLKFNLKLNNFPQIEINNIALSNKNEELNITTEKESNNPGSFNLFNLGGETTIKCFIGDEIIKLNKVDLIKIDVEGYESFVLDGLLKIIKIHRPKIVFEYDKMYHRKTNLPDSYIFDFLENLNYSLFGINRHGITPLLLNNIDSINILAIPNK